MAKQIENYIEEHLTGDACQLALDFVSFLRNSGIEFYKATDGCWANKIYYNLKFNGEYIAFISVNDPDEPENLWTFWSDDCKSYAIDISDENIKNIAWKHIDLCKHCGSCSGGKCKTVFGKVFEGVCICTFRIDNPVEEDIPFLKRIIEIHKNEILNKI